MQFIDIAIIGGGPGGLTAAATIVRQLHTAVVFDDHRYGNARSSHMHTVPIWGHRDPEEFCEAAREDILAQYSTVEFADVGVAKIEKKSVSHFHLVDEFGKEYEFRKIILAVGTVYEFPDIDGYRDAWGSRM